MQGIYLSLVAISSSLAKTALAGVPVDAKDHVGLVQTRLAVSWSALGQSGTGAFNGERRQEMLNYHDLQYVANIEVGGQVISGVVDTGSFELVVFEAHCEGCALAGKYDMNQSTSHSLGPLHRGLFYGSGDVYAKEAFDLLSFGPYHGINQSYWEVYEAYMPVLESARFQSIIGVGPPEMPASEAWNKTSSSIGQLTTDIVTGADTPETLTRVMEDMQYSVEISKRPTMLASCSMTMFSLCLGRAPGSNGFVIWNDTSALDQEAIFRRVQVIGRHTWTLNMTDVRIAPTNTYAKSIPISCSPVSCGAVIDSGTSLIMMPSSVVDQLQAELDKIGIDCSNFHELPSLTFNLDGHIFSLPPDSYLAEVTGQMPGEISSFMRIRDLTTPSSQCQLSVMESHSNTNWGPLWILGMPFFRSYYTTFSVGRSHADRALFVAKANPTCYPGSAEAMLAWDSANDVFRRRLDVSKLYLSPLVKRAMTESYIEL